MGVSNMIYKKYGKFLFKDYWLNWIIVSIFMMFGIIGIANEMPEIYCGIYILIAFVKSISILLPHRERFAINEDGIVVYNGNKVKEIFFPSQFIAIISYADICTNLAKKISKVNRTYNLKKRFSISFVQEISLQEALEKLHGKYTYRYTNCWVEELLKQNFIYSFVCNQSMLEEILRNKDFTLIIPETLSNMINIKNIKGDIYVDKGF